MSIVGYVRSTQNNQITCDVQMAMIERYCTIHNIICTHTYCDLNEVRRNAGSVIKMHELGYIHAYRSERTFSAFEQMLEDIVNGKIHTILVDLKCRFHANKMLIAFFEEVCKRHDVHIIEVAGYMDESRKDNLKHPAIYHFTDKSKDNPKVYEKEIDRLYTYVSRQKCWDTPTVYLDYSLKKSDHKRYEEFRKNIRKFDILLVTDFFHIEDKLGTFFKELLDLQENGVLVVSLKEGTIKEIQGDFLCVEKKVAIYDRWFDPSNMELNISRLKAFVRFKTNWTITGIYIEEARVETDSGQKELQKLINDMKQYDAVLVKKFHNLHWRTSMFFKIVKNLGVSVYSMIEGGIYLEECNL